MFTYHTLFYNNIFAYICIYCPKEYSDGLNFFFSPLSLQCCSFDCTVSITGYSSSYTLAQMWLLSLQRLHSFNGFIWFFFFFFWQAPSGDPGPPGLPGNRVSFNVLYTWTHCNAIIISVQIFLHLSHSNLILFIYSFCLRVFIDSPWTVTYSMGCVHMSSLMFLLCLDRGSLEDKGCQERKEKLGYR